MPELPLDSMNILGNKLLNRRLLRKILQNDRPHSITINGDSDTKYSALKKITTPREETLSRPLDVELKTLRACLYRLQSKSYRSNLWAACSVNPFLQEGMLPSALAASTENHYNSSVKMMIIIKEKTIITQNINLPGLTAARSFGHTLHLFLNLPENLHCGQVISHQNDLKPNRTKQFLTCIVTSWSWQMSWGGKFG